MLRLLLLPSNLVCDAMHIRDETERGMVRMLVNTVLWMTLGIVVLTAFWWR
jgi:hypothetical protein